VQRTRRPHQPRHLRATGRHLHPRLALLHHLLQAMQAVLRSVNHCIGELRVWWVLAMWGGGGGGLGAAERPFLCRIHLPKCCNVIPCRWDMTSSDK
jgi:hypothetical protein